MCFRLLIALTCVLAMCGCYGSEGGEAAAAQSHQSGAVERVTATEQASAEQSQETEGELPVARTSGLSSGEMVEMGEVGLMPALFKGFGESVSADCDFDDPFGNCQ